MTTTWVRAAAAVAVLSCAGCASDAPGLRESLTLSAPAVTSDGWTGAWGTTRRVELAPRLHGGRLAALRVTATDELGRPAASAPAVVALVDGGRATSSPGDGATTVVTFDPPIADGAPFALDVTAADPAPEAWRLRLVPVVVY
ncbi:MAG TPA: hypothetical protein VEI02_10855 [Planctomycetota bacterium]|nr:hypothetical protein [Planctomycetota bacterium]